VDKEPTLAMVTILLVRPIDKQPEDLGNIEVEGLRMGEPTFGRVLEFKVREAKGEGDTKRIDSMGVQCFIDIGLCIFGQPAAGIEADGKPV
jgi:hypothetical protein